MSKKLVLGMVILGATGLASAADLSNKIGIGVKGGYAIPVFGNTFNDVADADLSWGGHLRYYFNAYNQIELGYFRSNFEDVNTKLDNYTLMHVWRTSGDNAFSPVMGYGVGLTKIKDFYPSNLKLSLLARLGMEQTIGEHFSVGLYADYQWTSKLMGDIPGTRGLHTVTPTLALNWYFGGGKSYVAYEEPKKDEVSSYASSTYVNQMDSDGDGVYDQDDKCANTKTGIKVNAYGCAVDETASMKINVEFPTGKSTIGSQYNDHLKEVAEFLREHKDTRVQVKGFTDNTGNWTFNEKLSQKRAQAVVDSLARLGVERNRMSAIGFGPRDPIADNSTPEGRKENRRVVAEIIDSSNNRY